MKLKKYMSFRYLNLVKPNEHTEDYHIRKRNGNFLIENEDKKYIYVGKSLVSFETSDKRAEFFSKERFDAFKYPYAYSKRKHLLYASSKVFHY